MTGQYAAPVGPVHLRERTRRGLLPFDFDGREAARDVITERLYTCADGWQLGARRGGRLHLAGACDSHPDGKGTWEVFVLNPVGTVHTKPGDKSATVGWVTTEQLERMAYHLASWFTPREVAAS